MAKVKLASYLTKVSGRLGNVVYYNTCSGEYARIYVKPENPDTDEQKTVRKTFGNAVRSWQSLPAEQQQKYNKKARRLNLSGYNLYISAYMKENLLQRDIKRCNQTPSMAFNNHSYNIQRAVSSVTSASCLQYGPPSPYIQAVPGSALG